MSGKGGPELKKFMDKKVMRECRSPRACRAPRAHAARPRTALARAPPCMCTIGGNCDQLAGVTVATVSGRGGGRWRYEGPEVCRLLRDPRL
jgi:hypothetical protein